MEGKIKSKNVGSKVLAFIPARGGSKGLPDKNILPICGKPLIAWSIEQALASKRIDEVYVSTDSQIIADISMSYGAKVPFIRPDEISGDKATTESAMLHFCDYMEEIKSDFDTIVLLQATSPVRRKGVLDEALSVFEEEGHDSLLSVSESHRFFWRMPSAPEALYDYRNRPRRQDIDKDQRWLLETGSFYITKKQSLIESGNRLCGKVGVFQTSEQESYEIDTNLDFKVCELILADLMKEGSV